MVRPRNNGDGTPAAGTTEVNKEFRAQEQKFKPQTLCETLSAPVLSGVEVEHFARFKRLRQKYELEIREKNKEDGVEISLATYKSSVEPSLLWLLVRRGYIDVASVDDVTEEHVKACIDARAVRDIAEMDLASIDRAVAGVRMRLNIFDARSRVDTLALDYVRALENAGYRDFIERCPRIAIEHISKRLKPELLSKLMQEQCKLQEDSGLHKKDLFVYLDEVVRQAIVVEKTSDRKLSSSIQNSTSASADRQGKHRRVETMKRKALVDSDGKTEPSKKRKLPKCLNVKCSQYHFVKDCKKTSGTEAARLLTEYKEKKKHEAEPKRLNRLGSNVCSRTSTIFTAKFLQTVEAIVMADVGADENLMPPTILNGIQSADQSITVTMLDPPMVFSQAVNLTDKNHEPVKVICKRSVILDVELNIRHGSSLLLRNAIWYVPEQDADYVLIGRPVLEVLGLNTRDILASASDRNDGIVDVGQLLDERQIKNDTDNDSADVFHNLNHDWKYFDDAAQDTYIDIGEDDPADVEKEIQMRISEATSSGMSESGIVALKAMISTHRRIFKIRLGQQTAANVEPMHVKIKPGYKPITAKARRYAKDQREFLNSYVQELERMGLIRRVANAEWTAPPLLVPKDSKSKFRLTFDLRAVNAATVKQVWPMPHIESECADFAGADCFAVLDFVSGYWQLPLSPESQKYHCFITPDAVYAPTRTLQGGTNAVFYFQSTMQKVFKELGNGFKAWLDDFTIYAKGEKLLLNRLETFFRICSEKNLFLSIRKSVFFTKEVRWCGRLISSEGVRLDPTRLSAIQNVDLPKTAAELCEFIHCVRWMSVCIPNCAQLLQPLVEVLEAAYASKKRRTKRSIRNVTLQSLSWGPIHDDCYSKIQESLRNSVTLSFQKEGMITCVYTDASEMFWAGVVTQAHPAELQKEAHEQRHEPLAFCGAKFKGAECRWSTFEKEAYAIFQVFKKMDYLFLNGNTTHIFTDHRNLLFVFSPMAIEPSLGRHVISKVQRWALFLSQFEYCIEHIPGNDNVYADMLTRWMSGYRRVNQDKRMANKQGKASVTGNNGVIAILTSETNTSSMNTTTDFEWPSMETILAVQKEQLCPDGYEVGLDGMIHCDGRIWIPLGNMEMKMRLMVLSHGGICGHRGIDATLSNLSEAFIWNGMKTDVRKFVQGCLHCIVSRTGAMIPRPLGSAIHGSVPNEVVHCDFLFIGPSVSGEKYLLLIKDDLSGYLWLWKCETATSLETTRALSKWVSTFGVMDWLVTDQGSHFKNEILKELTEEFGCKHHFTTAYSPWANGTVERANRDVLRSFKALLSEWRLAPQYWKSLVNCVQSILNSCPRRRLGFRDEVNGIYRSAQEVFTGMKPKRPFLRALPLKKFADLETIDEIRMGQVLKIDDLQKSLEKVHKEVGDVISVERAKSILRHNKTCKVLPANFHVGDFVLVRRAITTGHKLQFVWRGPRRIVSVHSSHVFDVEDLINHKRETVHARRLLWYRASMENSEVDDSMVAFADHSEASYETVEKILDISCFNEDIFLSVSWSGLPDEKDLTWEPVEKMLSDIPEMVAEFVNSAPRSAEKDKVKRMIRFQ